MGSRPSHATRRSRSTSPDAYRNETHFRLISRRQAAHAFGAALRSARLDHSISQMALAAAGDFDPTSVSLLERGRRAPTFFTILRLAEALQMSPVRLFADAVTRMQGDTPDGVATLYRLAYLLPDSQLAEVEASYPTLETATSALDIENLARKADSGPELTHVVEYVRAGTIKLTRSP